MASLPRAGAGLAARLGVAALLVASACSSVVQDVSPPPQPPAGVRASVAGSPTAVASAHHRHHHHGSGGSGGLGHGGSGGTPAEAATVVSTVDGDTIHVRYHGRLLDVRLIGVDTPETVDPSQPVQCYGHAASRFTARALTGRRIRLEFDVERHDRYGRTLAYVWLRGRLFNRRLVAGGYATVSTYPPDVRYVGRFEAAQRAARADHRGLWAACAAGGGGGGRRCDPAYPGVCIPSPPPDLDCADVRFHDFRVLPPDPQGFDGDHNGRGCET